MAELVLGLAGSAIGGSAAVTGALGISAAMGASVGWAIGSMLGGMIGPKQKIEGPRLQDGKVQASTHGQAIPIIYGSFRTAGNIIDFSGMREHSKVERSKKAKSQVTTYSYECDVAVGICEGEIGGVRRIWANNELIYSVAEDADLATIQASNNAAGNIKIYTGSETQLPDPTLEALHGAGNVPAYRGLAYIVISRIWVEKYGNRLPNFEFEVVGTAANYRFRLLADGFNRLDQWGDLETTVHRWVITDLIDTRKVSVYSFPSYLRLLDTRVTPYQDVFGSHQEKIDYPTVIESLWHKEWTTYDNNGTRYDYTSSGRYLDGEDGPTPRNYISDDGLCFTMSIHYELETTIVEIYNSGGEHIGTNTSSAITGMTTASVLFGKGLSPRYGIALPYGHYPIVDGGYPQFLWDYTYFPHIAHALNVLYFSKNIFIAYMPTPDGEKIFSSLIFYDKISNTRRLNGWSTSAYDTLKFTPPEYALPDASPRLTIISDRFTIADSITGEGYVTLLAMAHYRFVEDGQVKFRINFYTSIDKTTDFELVYVFEDDLNLFFSNDAIASFSFDSVGRIVGYAELSPNTTKHRVLKTTVDIEAQIRADEIIENVGRPPSARVPNRWGKYGHYFAFGGPTNAGITAAYLLTQSHGQGKALLSDIVDDVTARVGVVAENSALAEAEVGGYCISRQISARGAIEPLQNAYFFDAVESDSGLKFVMRGGSPVATIIEDDMMAGIDQPADGDPATVVRGQEVELPQSVSVSYADWDSDYQTSSELVQRIATPSLNKTSVELPIAMSATQAARIADVWMYQAWSERTQLAFKVGAKHMLLEPTDVVTVETAGLSFKARITSKTDDRGVIDIAAVVDGGRYTSNATGSSNFGSQSQLAISSPTMLFLVDAPVIVDAEDDAGFYAAMIPEAVLKPGVVWPGATLLVSESDSSAPQTVGSASMPPACVGKVLFDVGAARTTGMVDQSQAITVLTNQVEMESITRERLLRGGNLFAVIDGHRGVAQELLQFQFAEEVGEFTYRLTGLLRGRFGTVAAYMPIIKEGAFLVQLNPRNGIIRVPAQPAQIGMAVQYRAATNGTPLEDAPSIAYAPTGWALRPYAPVRVHAWRVGYNWHMRWTRRSRIDGGWREGVDVPLGEAQELYSVRIEPFGVERFASTQSFIYTAAMQVADGGLVAELWFSVAQVSAAVGRGDAAFWKNY